MKARGGGPVPGSVPPAEQGPEADAITRWLRDRTGADRVEVAALERLAGGAIQETWGFDAALAGGTLPGHHRLVFRMDPACRLPQGIDRAGECAVQRIVRAAGVTVAEPLFLDADGSLAGRPGYVMRRVDGTADPRALVHGRLGAGTRAALARGAGRQLAILHRITPDTLAPERRPACLARVPADPALSRIESLERELDTLRDPLPAIEWALRQLRLSAPTGRPVVLCHGDYRVGNIMVNGGAITGVLDWEFAGWSDPMEDIGWFCARCWRHGADDREAGGLAARSDLEQGYADAGGRPPDRTVIAFWEAVAVARWAIIAHCQSRRDRASPAVALDLALTGRKTAELELEAMTLAGAVRRG